MKPYSHLMKCWLKVFKSLCYQSRMNLPTYWRHLKNTTKYLLRISKAISIN